MRTDTRDETDDVTTTHPLHGAGATAGDAEDDDMDPVEEARRARWAATGTGVLLALAGTAAALLRLGGRTPALVPAAFATGAAICAFAAYLGSRGHTRRALWLLVLGVMVMAFGDQAH